MADSDGWPESPSAVLFRDDATVGDDAMYLQHSLCLPGRAPNREGNATFTVPVLRPPGATPPRDSVADERTRWAL